MPTKFIPLFHAMVNIYSSAQKDESPIKDFPKFQLTKPGNELEDIYWVSAKIIDKMQDKVQQ